MLDELAEGYTVERREIKESLGPEQALVRVVRLVPRTPVAAPVAIAFTELPGLLVRLGRWWVDAMPRSRADDPADLVVQLRCRIDAVIEGGLWERAHRGFGIPRFQARLIGDEVDEAREGLLTPRQARDARRGGFAGAVQWAPWPIRPAMSTEA